MQRLAELQLHFRDAVVSGGDTRITLPLTGGGDPAKRLVIHQRNYQSSLIEALRTKYPATEWLVGTRVMTETAARFIQECPPTSPCIAEFGVTFPDFLAARVKQHAYIRDFGRLEWCVGMAAIAVDESPINASLFSSIQADSLLDLVARLQPGTHYLNANWPVDELMMLFLSGTAPDRLELVPCDLCIEIRGARGEFRIARLEAGDFTFRQSLCTGLSIGAAAERAIDMRAGFAPGRALAALFESGLVTAIAQPQ
jgi:hypothetical protein